MNEKIIKKKYRWVIVAALIITFTLLLVIPAIGKVDTSMMQKCEDFAFSTSEDFLTRGPVPPDGNPIISDGDLLGLNWSTCARNEDLLATFNITDDLGLDAVDVINVDNFILGFSTELDSPPEAAYFTAGDLLLTNGGIIPNQALTYAFGDGTISYDLGLDALHFVGELSDIEIFVDLALQFSRGDWLSQPDRLKSMLLENGVDIWFSTEGTYTPADPPGFLDGDLLSAASGNIIASNDQLIHPNAPAGLPSRGVDFGLDAVTSDRTNEVFNIHFSTEILYDGEFSFTDGDLLKINSDVIAATSSTLVNYFDPAATMLGLDAVYIGVEEQESCVSKLTKISGVDVADISLTDGTVNAGVLGINAPAPFGGTFNLEGALCPDVQRYKVVYRLGGGDPWEPIKVISTTNWTVKTDAFFPPTPDCLDYTNWSSDSLGWYNANDYRHLTEVTLHGCNAGLALTVWNSELAYGGADERYELVLVTDTSSGIVSDTLKTVQLDNTQPIVELEKDAGICNTITSLVTMIKGRMQDEYFYQYRLKLSGDGYSDYFYPSVAYYDSATDNVEATGTTSWSSYVDLHNISLADLAAVPTACGYTVQLYAWDRTVVGGFNFPANFASRCVGCRFDDDTWTFDYAP